jgi:serine/threonine-protein kinase
MVHLDVKPRNIVMGPVPRLIDLSVARRLDDIGSVRGPIGTDAYMAPEQADSTLFERIGPASDVWGMGVTLYEAASKRLPFPHGNPGASGIERWPQLTADPMPPPAKVGPAVAALVMAAMERDTRNRPTPLDMFEAFDDLAATHGLPRVRFR